MTTATATEVSRRRRNRPPAKRTTGAQDLRDALLAQIEATTGIRFPDPYWWQHPVEFFRRILGVEPWTKQIEIIEAIRDYDRVACKSGRRVSKSHTVAGIALCWYCSWPDARVIMSSTTARQVDGILWRQLTMMRARAGRCVECKAADPEGFRIPAPCPHSARIDGEIGMLARTGLKSDDFREIVGFTARESEAVQGIAGSRLLFILDEASGIPQPIFDAIEGNRAGGGKAILMGNPTKNSGEFHEAFGKKALRSDDPESTGYFGLTISSEESPNVVEGRDVIPGLATRAYIRERELEWGRESALFKIHVLGEFAENEGGKIFSIHTIAQAEERWRDDTCDDCGGSGLGAKSKPCGACHGTGQAPAAGRLFIGLDPAGATGSGDESAFCGRRGLKMLALQAHLGLSEDAHVAHLLSLIGAHKVPRETPVVVLDREGEVGWKVYNRLREFLDEPANRAAPPFELVGVRSSEKAVRMPHVYERVRDELAGNLERWFRDGGMILEDTRLAKELHTLEWEQSISGKLKLTPKKAIRKELGRSPDRYDALSLACWEPLSLVADDLPASARVAADDEDDDMLGPGPMDPYRAGSIDPYGRGWG